MSGVFVDTSALYALFAPRDSKHREAVAILRELGRARPPLVTTDLCLVEAYVLVHARTGRAGLLRFRKALSSSAWLEIIPMSPEHQANAWSLLDERTDKDYSFVDAGSFVVMRILGIERAFTFDDHFSQEGFDVLKARPKAH